MPDIVDTLERGDHGFTGRQLVLLATDYDRIERARAMLLREVEAVMNTRLHREAGNGRLSDLANALIDSPLGDVVKACDEARAEDDFDGRSPHFMSRAAE